MSQYNLPDLRPGAGQSQPAPQAGAPPQAVPGQLPDLRPAPQAEDLDLSGYSREELVEAYRQLPRDDPRREAVKQQIIQIGNVPFERGIYGPGASAVAGATDALSFGMSDELNAGLAAVTGGSYDEELQRQRQMMDNAEVDNPGAYLAGEIGGTVVQAGLTLGASVPQSAAARLGTNVAAGAAQMGAYDFGSSDGDIYDRLAAGGEGALQGAAFGAIPSVGEGIWKGGKYLVNKGVKNVQKITNPRAYAEKEVVDDIVTDWNAQRALNERAARRGEPELERRFLDGRDVIDAEGAGQPVMVSDLGGDTLRRKLKAVDNASPEGSRVMRGAAASRQVNSGQRVADVVADSFGDTINPKTVRDELIERAREENAVAYRAAEQNPNAAHLWSPTLQGAISTDFGKAALRDAIQSSRTEAIRRGEQIFEPVFEEGPDGLMTWTGQFRRPTGEIADGVQGMGIGLRFWDHIKRGFDKQIEALGPREATQAAAIRDIKNQMLRELDAQVPEYAVARGTARGFFGMEDAHEAGAEYFRRMNAFGTAEARQALQEMRPAERELFARGYASELVHRITQMGDAENVNKLFRSSEARMKMRDALGERAADQLEAFTHREMVQGLLGRHLGENSTTIQQAIAMEGLKITAMGAGGTYATGDVTTGFLAGLAMRGGYRFAQRKVIQRYAREMADLVTSDDPEVIARILNKVSRETGFMEFSRSVSNGAQRVGAGATRAGAGTANAFSEPNVIDIPGGDLPTGGGRIEPRMPFSKGGVVKKAAQAAGEMLGLVEKEAPKAKRIAELGVREEVSPVMINGKDVSQWGPSDWGQFGQAHGRADVGPASDEEFFASLVEVPTLSGGSFTIPGGLDDVEKPFTYYDLLHLKSQAVDPNDLPPDVHRRLHNRMVRTMQPGPEFDDVDRYNQLAFGMISPNQPLTPNELAMARVRAKSPEDIEAMANMTPWSLGDEVSKDDRQAYSRGISQYFGLQSKAKGGIGASGSADYSRISDMAKLHREKPEFYRFKGAGEGGVDDAENWSNFVGRVAAQTPGLSYKTASLGTVWQDPANAAISAIDRHMAASFRGAMFEKPSDVNKFNRRVLQKFNKGRPRGQAARSFDEMLEMPGGRGVLVDELFVELNRRGKTKLRSAKTGEINPKAPEWAQNADWIREPEKVDRMAEAYVRALRENDRLARENNQGLFANQWMIWDRLRQRLEPHEIMHPSIRHLPRMSLDQIKAADKAHSKAGYKAESGKARPSNPSGLAYFSIGAPLGGLGALAAAQEQGGGEVQ